MEPTKFDPTSHTLTDDLKTQLKTLVPEAFTEDAIDFDRLKTLLGEMVDGGQERYSFTWPGKTQAIRAAQTPSIGTLVPDKAASEDWDTTQNLYLEGDNLEILKLLQKSYTGKVKMIYIDPPYNTGKDFVYPDNYGEGLKTYLEYTGQVDGEGKKITTNTEIDGRYHSKWLNMMYPRLMLARNLLKDDGVIFISIDDHEQANLKKICDEIFAPDNFVGQFKWNRVAKAPSLSETIRTKYEYLLCYKKSVTDKFFGKKSYNTQGPVWHNPNKQQELLFPAKSIKVPKSFEKGLKSEKYQVELLDEIFEEGGVNKFPVRILACSAWGQEKINQYVSDGGVFQIKKDIGTLYSSLPQGEDNFIAPSDLISKDECGVENNTDASMELEKLGLPFTNPKPVSLVKYLVNMVTHTDPTAIVLDFFSGSATTAHAVMELNTEDGGNRRFVVTQLQEPTPEDSESRRAGYHNIAELGRERIKRAGVKIRADYAEKLAERETPLDTGFRTYRLTASTFNTWDTTSADDIQAKLLNATSLIKAGVSTDDVLAELILKSGFGLSESVTAVEVEGVKVYSVSNNELMIVLQGTVTEAVVRGIADMSPKRFIAREDAFPNDASLTNTAQIMKDKGIDFRVL